MKKFNLILFSDRCKGCSLCIKFCPNKKIALSKDVNKKGYKYAQANDAKCNGCGFCFVMCPDAAVEIEEEI